MGGMQNRIAGLWALCAICTIKTGLRAGLTVKMGFKRRLGGGEGAKCRNLRGEPSRGRDQPVQTAWGRCMLAVSEEEPGKQSGCSKGGGIEEVWERRSGR